MTRARLPGRRPTVVIHPSRAVGAAVPRSAARAFQGAAASDRSRADRRSRRWDPRPSPYQLAAPRAGSDCEYRDALHRGLDGSGNSSGRDADVAHLALCSSTGYPGDQHARSGDQKSPGSIQNSIRGNRTLRAATPESSAAISMPSCPPVPERRCRRRGPLRDIRESIASCARARPVSSNWRRLDAAAVCARAGR